MSTTRLDSVRVSGDGLKGWSGEQRFTGCDVLSGPNGAGKSTRILAILAGLRGLGETPNDPIREYLGPTLPHATVDLQFTGARLSRSLADSGRTTVAKKADALAEQIAGPHLVRWDLADFATASDAARAKLLEKVCELGSRAWTADLIRTELAGERLAVEEGQPHPAVTPLEQLVDTVFGAIPFRSPEAWIAQAYDFATKAYTEANAAQRERSAEAAALAMPAVEQAPVESAPTIDARISAKQQEAANLRAKIVEEGRALATYRQVVAAREAQISSANERVRRAEANLASARRLLEGLPQPVAGDVAAAVRNRLAAEKDVDDARGALRAVDADVSRLQAERATIERLSGAVGPSVCAHCGQADPLALGAQVAALTASASEAIYAQADARADLDSAEAMLALARKAEAAAERSELVEARRVEYAQHVDERQNELSDAKAAQGAALALPEPAAVTVADVGAQVAALDAEIAGLRKLLALAQRAAGRELDYARAVTARDAALERFEAVKVLGKRVKGLRERMAASAFEPLEREASVITEPVLGARFVFGSASDFGLGDRSWWSLSDGERAVCCAGLSYAFARLSGVSWRAVLLDGAEAIDPARLRALVAELGRHAQAGDVDNVVIAVRADVAEDFAGATNHWLGGAWEALRITAPLTPVTPKPKPEDDIDIPF